MGFKNLLLQSVFWRSCSFFTSFVLNLCIARFFGPALSGELNLLIALLAFFLILSGLNLDAAIIYFSAGNRISLNRMAGISAASIFFGILSVFFLPFFIKEGNLLFEQQLQLYFFAGVYMAGMQLSNLSTAFFYGKKNFNIPGLLISLTNLALIIILFIVISGGFEHLFSYYLRFFFILPLLQGITLAIWLKVKYMPSFHFDFPAKEEIKKIFRFSIIVFLANLLLFLMYRIDYWMLAELDHSKDRINDLGNYIQISKIGQVFIVVSSAIGSAVFSNTSARGFTEKKSLHNLCRTIRMIVLAGFILYLFFFLIGKPVMLFFYGWQYDSVYPCGLLLIPGIIFLMTVSVTANYLSGSGYTRINLIGAMTSLTVILLGDYFLIPYRGIYAAAFVSTIGYLLYAIYMLANFRKIINCKWKEILLFQNNDLAYLKEFLSGIIKNIFK